MPIIRVIKGCVGISEGGPEGIIAGEGGGGGIGMGIGSADIGGGGGGSGS